MLCAYLISHSLLLRDSRRVKDVCSNDSEIHSPELSLFFSSKETKQNKINQNSNQKKPHIILKPQNNNDITKKKLENLGYEYIKNRKRSLLGQRV